MLVKLRLVSLQKLCLQAKLKQNLSFFYLLKAWSTLSLTLLFWANMCCQICTSPWQLQDIIRSGKLLYGVPSRNSPPIPSSTWNRNSTWLVDPFRFDFNSCSFLFKFTGFFYRVLPRILHAICVLNKKPNIKLVYFCLITRFFVHVLW